MPKDRSLALGMVAAETRGSIAARQAAGTLPWIGVKDPAQEERLQADHAARMQESGNFQFWWPRKAHQYPRPAACVAEKPRLGRSMVRGRW